VGAFECRGRYIGTIRFMPMGEGIAPCDAILGRHQLALEDYEDSWEVGRLVLAPQYRSGPESLKRCLFLTFLCLARETPSMNFFASCTPLLARLYRRFGFAVLVKDACSGPDGSYCLIHGHLPTVLLALAANSTEQALAERELERMGNACLAEQ
jgi:hypothetical protein